MTNTPRLLAPSGPTLPATCSPGPPQADIFIKTGSSPGMYICDAPNHWTLVTTIGVPGIFSINGDTSSSQTIALGSAGSAPNIAQTPGVTTINIPVATTGVAGIVSTGAQIIPGAKTFTSPPVVNSAGTVLLSVGPNGATNPAFQVGSNGSVVNGVSIAGNASGGNVSIAAIGPDANIGMDVFVQGTGDLTFHGAFGVLVYDHLGNLTIPNKIVLPGSTSGSASLQAQAVAGSFLFKLPNTAPSVGQSVSVAGVSGTTITLGYASASAVSSFEGICRYDVKRDFAASGSGQTTTGSGSSAVTPTLLTLTSPIDFAIGQSILVAGAGAAGKNLITTISNLAGNVVTLASPILTTVTLVKVQHDDSAAINAAIAAISTAGGGALLFPAGTYRCNGAIDVTCNSILQFPQITRISGAPVSIALIGEMVAPTTGSAVLPTKGVIIDAQDWDGTASNLSAIISGKAYSGSGTVIDTTFNYTQVIIENMTFRNKPNPFLSGVQMNNTEGLIMRNCLVDAGEALTFNFAGFVVLTQPTHATAIGVVTPGLNNICNNQMEGVNVVGYFGGVAPGDNLRFSGGCYAIQCDTGLLCHGNAAMMQGPFGIYLCKNPITVDNALGVATIFNLQLEIQIINTGTWYDVAANRTIYDPGNFAGGSIYGVLQGSTGVTGCQNLDIFDGYSKNYFYNTTLVSAPFVRLSNFNTATPGNQFELLNDANNYGVMGLAGSAFPDVDKRNNLILYAAKKLILAGGDAGAADGFSLRAGGQNAAQELIAGETFFGIGRSTFRGIVKVPISQYPPSTPTQITANQNNYAPSSGSFQRWSTDASRNVTGLIAGQDGESMEVWNVGGFNIVIQNENASSTAANRFTTTTGADLTVTPNQCVKLRYDTTSARWRAAKLP